MAVTVSNLTTLANQIQTRISALSGSSTNRDMLYLAKMVQSLNGNLGLATVLEAGDTAAANLSATATTQIGQVNSAGTSNIAAVNAQATTKSNELSALAASLASTLQGYNSSQTKQFFMSQST